MEATFQSQQLLVTELSRLRSSYDAKGRKPVSYLKRLIGIIDEMWEKFSFAHEKILGTLSGEEKELTHPYFAKFSYSNFRESCLEFQSEVEELIEQSENPCSNDRSTMQRDVELKLPRIELPHFDGDYGGWTSFKDLFSSLILNKDSLSKVEKLHYLKCSLKGEPANLLKSYKITAQNLEVAWKTLTDRYDNKAVMLNKQLRRLINLDQVSETAASIKGLLDSTMESVQLLEAMEVKNLWHTVVVFLGVQRLPSASRALWEQGQASKKEMLLLADFKNFLNTRFRTLEATSSKTSNPVVKKIHAHHTETQLECCVCKQQHNLRNCSKFVSANQKQRFELVKRHQLCLNCLSRGHLAMNCPSLARCLKCKKLHHTMLHREADLSAKPHTFPSPAAEPFVPNKVNSLTSIFPKNILLATAIVNLEGSNGLVMLRALLDQGSQASFITEEAVQRSGLKRRKCDAVVSGIGDTQAMRSKGLVTGNIRALNDEEIAFEAFVLTKLTNNLPTQPVQFLEHPDLIGIRLADPTYNIPGRIDMVLGADIYGRLLLPGTRLILNELLLQRTKLGWILSGKANQVKEYSVQSFMVETRDPEALRDQLKKFWEVEEPVMKVPVQPEDILCENIFKESTTRNEDGRFVVRLPFKSKTAKNQLGESRRSVEQSLNALERRLERDTALREDYMNCMQNYLDKGYLSPVEQIKELTSRHGEINCQAHYLPHHAVRKDSTTTTTRIVFDASRKTSSGFSLNDVLLTGPSIHNEMMSVILKWRLYTYAFSADIAKMFLQILINPADRDYQRVVWRFRPEDEICHYRLNTVTFGITCSPFLAIRCLKQLADEGKSIYPKAADAVMNNFYVDDVLSGGYNWEEAIAKIVELNKLLKSGGFHLRKWISNDVSLLKDIPAEDIDTGSTLNLNFDMGHKSLGVMWYPTTDSLAYRYNLSESNCNPTKRSVLSDISRLYDPLGWISPIIVRAKCLIQNMWIDRVG